jgi:hypothetical protein
MAPCGGRKNGVGGGGLADRARGWWRRVAEASLCRVWRQGKACGE